MSRIQSRLASAPINPPQNISQTHARPMIWWGAVAAGIAAVLIVYALMRRLTG